MTITITISFSILGILKNKITYPPALTDKNLKNRLREKLGDYNSPTISYKSPSVGSNEGLRCSTETDGIIIEAPALPLSNTLNIVTMEPRTSPTFVEEDTNSESVKPFIYLFILILIFCFAQNDSFWSNIPMSNPSDGRIPERAISPMSGWKDGITPFPSSGLCKLTYMDGGS